MNKVRIAGVLMCAFVLIACSSQPSYAPKATNQALDPAEKRAQLHTQLAGNYYSIANYAVALQEIDIALQSKPNYAPAYGVQGLVYMELRDDANAERSFKKALSLDATDPDSNNNYGWFLCQRKREKDGIKYFMTALKNPLYATPERAWDNAGTCARQINDTASAQEYFTNALRAQPSDATALFNLADIAYARGDYAGAKSYLVRIPDSATPTAASLWLNVRVARRLGDRDEQASYGLQLRQKFPDSREAQLLKAGAYE